MTVKKRPQFSSSVTSSPEVTPTTPLLVSAPSMDAQEERRAEDGSDNLGLISNETAADVTPDENAARKLPRILSLMASSVTDDRGWSVSAGLATVVIFGSLLGIILPKNYDLPTPWYRTVSSCIGYTYFLAWSISFYPQVIKNIQRKSTSGLSVNFCVLNVLGFVCYTMYTTAMYNSSEILREYKERNGPDAEITVQSNDIAFALHAVTLSILTLCQIVYYRNRSSSNDTAVNNEESIVEPPARQQSLFKSVIVLVVVTANIILFYPCLIYFKVPSATWLNYLYLLSYVKVFITTVKYIPQAVLNYKRKSTSGWSIWQILLDITGGLLSDLQLVFDSLDMHDMSGITGNFAKFCLGSVSIMFDIIFIVQHYVLYPQSAVPLEEPQDEPIYSRL